MWTLKKYFHKHSDAWRLLFMPFLWMRFSHMLVWKPKAKWRRQKQEDGIIHRKGQSESERRTNSTRDRETDWLKCRYSQKTGRLTTKNTCHSFEYWIIYNIAFSHVFSLLPPPLPPWIYNRFSVVNNCLLSHITFPLVLDIYLVKLSEKRKQIGIFQLLTIENSCEDKFINNC